MSLSLVSATSKGFKYIDSLMLDRFQRNQFEHDERNHREIARLTVQRRMSHMTLHFAKYSGYLIQDNDDERLQQIYTDILIIGLSSANVLNIRLSDLLDLQEINNTEHISDLKIVLIAQAGAMAAACEKLDHLEKYPFREVLEKSVLAILTAVFNHLASRNVDVEQIIDRRLQSVRTKQFLQQKRE